MFPLPNKAAVDDMTILVGERTIQGVIKKRDEARRAYEAARKAGHVAALLDQDRPNLFTQSVANILPGNEVEVKIRYVETLPYQSSSYEFSFPMVVGPRFIPGAPTSAGNRGWACDFKFEAHHSLVPMETFLRCAVTEPLAGPCVELLCDTIAVALRERCLAGALRQVLS